MARVRSPNFPIIGLGKAIERARAIFDKEQQLPATRDVLSKHLGYSGYNGKSAKVISALAKYGLLEGVKDSKFRLSQRAMRILFPRNEADKQEALNEAGSGPVLFKDIFAEWDGGSPSDENLTNFLLHRGFSQSAILPAIAAYRDTQKLVTQVSAQYDATADTPFEGEEAEESEMELNPARSPQRERAVGSTKDRRPPANPGEPFTLQMVKGGLLGSFDLRNQSDLETFVAGLAALKVFLPIETPQEYDL